ncbi:protein kinase [Bacteroidota bacterium]
MINERFIIKKFLGKGRSRVFLCSDLDYPGRDLAVKIISGKADEAELKSFRDEFHILNKVNHPNIIPVYEFGTILQIDDNENSEWGIDEGDKFFTQDFIPGVELLDYPNLSEKENLWEITSQLCSVLYYLHQSNYIYYDLKSENILVFEQQGKPRLLLIDFGLTVHSYYGIPTDIRGTSQYMAPEIIMKEHIDHRIDLYSLGILLYRIVYNKFPFNLESDLDIYKAHMEMEFEFQASDVPEEICNVIKKLLSKNPNERFETTLQILDELDIQISNEMRKSWTIANTFCGRKEIMSFLKSHFKNENKSEVIVVRGDEGSGKTTLLHELNYCNLNSVLINSSQQTARSNFIQYFLSSLFFNESIYSRLDSQLKNDIRELLNKNDDYIIEDLKSIVMRVASVCNFILMIDDFHNYAEFAKDILLLLIPILQSNNVKIIVTEKRASNNLSDRISNRNIFILTPFTEQQLSEYLNIGFFKFFPRVDLGKIIIKYTDLSPRSIISLIDDLILLNILEFNPDERRIKMDKKAASILKDSQDTIYSIRTDQLDDIEIKMAKLISLFEIGLDEDILSFLLEIKVGKTYQVLQKLREKNIICQTNISLRPQFTSSGLKNYIYAHIDDEKNLHLQTAERLQKYPHAFNRIEIARQFEKAEKFNEAISILKQEAFGSDNSSTALFRKVILEHILSLPADENDLIEAEAKLCKVLYQLGETQKSNKLIDKVLKYKLSDKLRLDLSLVKGASLIRLGELNGGKNLLKSLLGEINDESAKQKILVTIADAEVFLNEFLEAESICKEVIDSEYSVDETKGMAYNLLGLVDLYARENLDGTIAHFNKALQIYERSGLPSRSSGMQVNLGNIYLMKKDFKNTEICWNNAFKTNLKVGNLQQEAVLHLNYGIFLFDKLEFDESIKRYKKAENTFSNLGYKYDKGLSLNNLGEIYLTICEYNDSLGALNEAKQIFHSLNNSDEEAEVFFNMGRLFYTLGAKKKLASVIKNFKKLIDNKFVIEKHKIKYEYLIVLAKLLDGDYEDTLSTLSRLRNDFYESGEREDEYNFVRVIFLSSEILSKLNRSEEAVNILDNDKFNKICKENILVKIEREYTLGMISSTNNQLKLKPAISYFLEAHDLIENIQLTELTWKVLYAIAKFYFDRGNIYKAKEYILSAKSLIQYFADKIEDSNLKKSYLSQPSIRSALTNLNLYEEKL